MPEHNISRRKVLQVGLPAAGIIYAGGLSQLLSCKSKNTVAADKGKGDTTHARRPKKTPVQRGNPYAGRDEMFLHNKSKTLHYPYIFKTYDQLKEVHFTSVKPTEWQQHIDTGAHFPKEKSALIFEKLALKSLRAVDNDSLSTAGAILGKSFTGEYAKPNAHNWRGYHLLCQVIALNNALQGADKWTAFSGAIKDVNVNGIKKLPKRHAWIASQSSFDQKIQYIQQHAEVYKGRIQKRAV